LDVLKQQSKENEMHSQYLGPVQVTDHYPGITADRLARWRWARTGPRYSKVGRQILYLREDVEAFLIANAQGGVNAG
jgi:hypothetical protein